MKFLILLTAIASLFLSGCKTISITSGNSKPKAPPPTLKNKVIQTVGYSSTISFKHLPIPQRKLLAMRGAKLDAYRNLAEEIYGLKIKGKTTVKDMVVKNDSYRVYIDTMIRGAHIDSISEKENGLFEAEVSMTLTPRYTYCLYNPGTSCINSANQYQPDVVDNQSMPEKNGFGIYSAPTANY